MQKEYIVPVTWQMCGFVKVKATSSNNAIQQIKDEPEDAPIPNDAIYVDGSYMPTTCEPNIVTMYTDEYERGKLISVPEPYVK